MQRWQAPTSFFLLVYYQLIPSLEILVCCLLKIGNDKLYNDKLCHETLCNDKPRNDERCNDKQSNNEALCDD